MDDFLSQIPPLHHHDMFFDEYDVFHHMDHGHIVPRFDLDPYMELPMSNQPNDDHQLSNEKLLTVSQNWANNNSSSNLSTSDSPNQLISSASASAAVGQIPNPSSTWNATNYNDIVLRDHHQAIEALRQTRNPRFPKPDEEHEVMTRAILAVLSNPNSSPSPNPSTSTSLLVPSQSLSSPTSSSTSFRTRNFPQQHLDDETYNGHIASTSTQLHHTISERRRREKLNENFQILRSLLPPGTKRDKASVLSSSVDHLTSLKSQILELTTINHNLEAELSLRLISPNLQQISVDEKFLRNGAANICVFDAAESSSSSRLGLKMINMHVTTSRDRCLLDLAIRVLELLEQIENVGLVSLDTKTLTIGLNPVNTMIFRLNIIDKDEKWDEGSFKEAVRRAVAELEVISS